MTVECKPVGRIEVSGADFSLLGVEVTVQDQDDILSSGHSDYGAAAYSGLSGTLMFLSGAAKGTSNTQPTLAQTHILEVL